MATAKLDMALRLKGTEDNVWVAFSELQDFEIAANLGQGNPDYLPPEHVRKALTEVSLSSDPMMHQYTSSSGHPRLNEALARLYSPIFKQTIHPMKEVLVTCGAVEALYCIIQSFVNPGDEVILIEPFYDCYEPMTLTAGGIPVYVPLRPIEKPAGATVSSSSDWRLDYDELVSKFTSKTKMIILNTPHNPLGKVFSREELGTIANLCCKHDVLCISDEVYEWIVYPDAEHVRIATLPGMWERTLTLGSASKTYFATGWRLGWAIGPQKLVSIAAILHPNILGNCTTMTQEAVAICLEADTAAIDQPTSYLHSLGASLLRNRDRLIKLLRHVGMTPIIPEGGCFVLADWSQLPFNIEDYDQSTASGDVKVVKYLIKEKKLATIPPSAFFSIQHRHMGSKYIRFCFIKTDKTLEAAECILRKWADDMNIDASHKLSGLEK